MSGSSVTVEELQSVHSIDREIYRRLAIDLGRDLMECMYVLALWLWLDEIGYPNIVLKLLTLPDRVLNLIADEGVLCLHSIQSEAPLYLSSTLTEIPVTQELMEASQISLSFLHQHRASALRKITKTVNDVWPRAFEDITNQALANRQPAGSSNTGGSVHRELVGPSAGFRPVAFQPPLSGSGIGISPPPAAVIGTGGRAGYSSQISILKPMAESWCPMNDNNDGPRSVRTMFMTFSRGYPVAETELREFFVGLYGSDCIEQIYMQDVPTNRQPRFARVVFRSTRMVAAILDGKERSMFEVNGKHVRARLHVEKQKPHTAEPAAPEGTS